MVTISVLTDVEAESEDEAIRLAEERSVIGLCHQCGGNRTRDEEWVTSGELDGEPQELTAEKMKAKP